MMIIDNGPGQINSLNDTSYNYNGDIGIELRGSSSQALYDKKSFGIETRDSLGDNLNVSLLGLPEENDWVLYGPYGDKSLIRNVLEYKLSNDMGRYASRTRYCELSLNGDYRGIYVLMEKVKRDKNRVDIGKLNPDENSGDDLTGGYIVKLDKYDGKNSGLGWTSPYPPPEIYDTEKTVYFQYEYPKDEDITQSQQDYIKQYVTAFEDALYKEDYNNPITGYKAYADINSMVDYFILNEISHNVDGYRLSTFIYKDKDSKDGKLTFGPIWDLNLGFGNADYCDGGSSEGWAFQFNGRCQDDDWFVPFWWYKLFDDVNFRTLLLRRWNQLRQGPLKTQTVLDFIDSTATSLHEAEVRNFTRFNILGTYIWPNLYIGYSYAAEINYLKNWVSDRFAWLDENLVLTPDGLENNLMEKQTVIYPNPFRDRINILLPPQPGHNLIVHLYDLYGKEIWHYPVSDKNFRSPIQWINGSSSYGKIQNGVYILSLTSGEKILFTRKLLRMD